MAMEPQQASLMSKINGIRLPSTYSFAILDLFIYVLQVSKNDNEEHCC